MKQLLLKAYYFGNNSPKNIDILQKEIRNIEWEAIKPFIQKGSYFLDIGCGAGYSMQRAKKELDCDVVGIDPEPYAFGVDRNWGNENTENNNELKILKGTGENLPFEDNTFDVVYSSHVLEHSEHQEDFLKEAARVIKKDGVLIIGMPTATMAIINLISNLIFTTHQRFFNFIFSKLKLFNAPKTRLKHAILPESHSFSNYTVLHDLKHYKIKSWYKLVSKFFSVKETLLPALYPYPDYLQFFKLKKSKTRSSSVFFICSKK